MRGINKLTLLLGRSKESGSVLELEVVPRESHVMGVFSKCVLLDKVYQKPEHCSYLVSLHVMAKSGAPNQNGQNRPATPLLTRAFTISGCVYSALLEFYEDFHENNNDSKTPNSEAGYNINK